MRTSMHTFACGVGIGPVVDGPVRADFFAAQQSPLRDQHVAMPPQIPSAFMRKPRACDAIVSTQAAPIYDRFKELRTAGRGRRESVARCRRPDDSDG